MAYKVTLEELLEAGAHFGHQVRRWNPRMEEYLYGAKDGVHVFDLAKTRECILLALDVLEKAAKEGKSILLVGTKKQAKEKVATVAQKAGIPYVNERWLGGTLTNFTQIAVSTRKLADLKEKLAGGEFKSYTKKERLLIQREIDRLERYFGGIATLEKKPDLMVIIDTHKEKSVVREASRTGVETIGLTDSNADPSDVTWPIPMNDDATKALEYVLDLFAEAILTGKKKPVSADKPQKPKKKVKVKVSEGEVNVAD